MQTKEVLLKDGKEQLTKVILEIRVEQGNALLTLVGQNLTIVASGSNFFESLIKIRIKLEEKQCFILCQGSVKNVYPSRMSTEMSTGRKAYKLQMGKQASLDDLVDIFDPADNGGIATVEEQRSFFLNWTKSLSVK